MIDDLFRKTLPREYGITRVSINLTKRIASGVFEEGDAVTCFRCKAKYPDRTSCQEKVMKIDAGTYQLSIVYYEAYVNQFNGRQIADGKRCDLLLCDESTFHKIVFCDMGCYADAYVAKKRVEVYQQTVDSMKRLLKTHSGYDFVNKFAEKQLVFFRRDPAIVIHPIHPSRGNVDQNMQIFITNPISSSAHVESDEIVNDIPVKFVIVNYPNVYNW
jgi:hypothetical protein